MATAPAPETQLDEVEHDVAEQPKGPDLADVHERALDRFDSVALPQAEMRAQSLADRRFVTIPGAQWEGEWGEQFENAPRPEIDHITTSLEKIETDFRENRLAVDYIPAQDGDTDTADTLDGLYRADLAHFKAQQAKDNAFQEAIRGGFGAYRLTTDYADPYDPDNDAQRVNPGLVIVDADQSVYFDPASKLYDKSDAKWAFIVTADPRATAVARWGAENIDDWPVKGFRWSFDWYTVDVVRTAEYFEVEDTNDRLLIFTNELTGEEQRFYASEMEDGAAKDLKAQGWKQRSRTAKRRRIRKYILNGTKVLRDCGYIAGREIPIVPVYGRRDFVDNMERWRGHVGKLKDRQRVYNSGVAKVVETNSMSPARTPILYEDELDPTLAEEWARRNIDRKAFLRRLRTYGPGGEPIVSGIDYLEPPGIPEATVASLQLSREDLVGLNDNADQVKANVSAEAMDIAAARVDEKSGIYLDNMRQSEQRAGEIYLGMAREVYFEPGRKVDTLTLDGNEGEAELNETVLDEQGRYRVRNDLTKGKYKVLADVQESTATKRQKTVRQALELATAFTAAQAPQDALPALYTAAMNMDGEGIGELQDFYRNRAIQAGSAKPTPEEQAAMQRAAEAQGQQPPSPQDQALQAAANEAQSKVQVNQAKAVETLASAELKSAQAAAVGGPQSAPDAPSGLSEPEAEERLANADLKRAQADNLRHGITIKDFSERRKADLADRQQEHAERQSRTAGQSGEE